MLALGAAALCGCGLFPRNHAPVAALTAMPKEGYRSLEVHFDAAESSDPDGDVLTYAWSFGDGGTESGLRAIHTFENPADYDVVLRVTDPDGLDDATMTTVRVREVPEGHVVLRFRWDWHGVEQRLEAAVCWDLYLMYRGRLRSPLVDNYDYGAFVADPLDDPTLEDLADALRARAGDSALDYAECVLAFVQSVIDYVADPPDLEWPFYPLETLVDGEGDCEDTAILYVSLLKARGIPCQLAFVDTGADGSPDHVLALVEVSGTFNRPAATVFVLDGRRYAVAETASGGLELGIEPWGLEVDDLIEVWPFR